MACFLSSTELVSSSKPTFRKLFCADKVNAFSLVFLFLAFRRVKQDAFNASVVNALTLLSVVFAFVPPPFPPPSLCEIIITFAFLMVVLALFVVVFVLSSSSNTDGFSLLLLERIICILRYPNEQSLVNKSRANTNEEILNFPKLPQKKTRVSRSNTNDDVKDDCRQRYRYE